MLKPTFFISFLLIIFGDYLFSDNFQDFLEQELIDIEELIKNQLNEIESGLDIQQHYYLMGQENELRYIISQYKYIVKEKK